MNVEQLFKRLQIASGMSRAEPVTLPAKAEEIAGELTRRGVERATVILWQIDRIRCGTWQDGAFHFADGTGFDAAYLVELRVFDETQELHLRREEAQLCGRFRMDGAGAPTEYVDTASRFWGERTDAGAWMTLCDRSRKIEIILPALPKASKYVGLVTRSYIGIHETGQAGYVDHRFYSIVPADMEGETDG